MIYDLRFMILHAKAQASRNTYGFTTYDSCPTTGNGNAGASRNAKS
jgi:hypothetical protein